MLSGLANIAGSCFSEGGQDSERGINKRDLAEAKESKSFRFCRRRKSCWLANESSEIISDRLLARQAQEEEANSGPLFLKIKSI